MFEIVVLAFGYFVAFYVAYYIIKNFKDEH